MTVRQVAVQPSTDRGGSVSTESGILPRVSRGTSLHEHAVSESDSTARSCLYNQSANVHVCTTNQQTFMSVQPTSKQPYHSYMIVYISNIKDVKEPTEICFRQIRTSHLTSTQKCGFATPTTSKECYQTRPKNNKRSE